MSEVATAARPILAVERDAARARELGGTLVKIRQGSRATGATAARWGKSHQWLDWLLKVSDAAVADPIRLGAALNFLDAGGAPNVAWSCISSARDSEATITLPALKRQGRQLLTDAWKGRWSLVDINLAARALLEARLGHAPVIGGTFDAAQRRALADLGKLWDESADFLLRTFEVCEAAAVDPDRFGFLVPVMCKADNPTAAWNRMRAVGDEQRCLELIPYDGSVQTAVLDPPWKEVNVSAAAGHAYAKMSLDEIRALPLQRWTWEDSHLYLWFINGVWGDIPSIVQEWGFEVKTVHTWVKEVSDLSRNDPKFSLGHEMRNTTEHFVFARRGSKLRMPRRSATYSTATHHRWPLGANSEKPDAFYDLVRQCSYGPFGEAFQRKPREDFINLYRQAEPPRLEAAE
ncbi:N6-adenosine-specific RNA methylase IME4 [Methylobacterium sp. PvP109]|uniref:N6-adenosine-specific RNA methylase IME4 n=1 Tax=Methylobacterium radiotolerans TaxID=31998 RepID=A0ABV2NQ22_9HYPH|nr:N6-adenosine-specific RNA methylase IME4 [Methylobacterium sp. PvP105]MBP2505455.1 N6-adenosine-specific RNA methylase IME4 [Methylobacterium sp. PvP109]